MTMSNQSVSNIANEKQIAAYTSEFRENRLAKPVDISLTVTAGHLHGRAYIWEREGTKEGDAEYQRFVCPLEEVTKVYINDNVKASPLYIQCDSHVNKVFHRKTIVVPCLENVAAIADQINELHRKFMEKYEAKQQQEMERKREALAAERQKELAEAEGKPADSKPPVDGKLPAESKSSIAPQPAMKAPEIKLPEPPKAAEKPSANTSVLTGDVAESLKALEKLESIEIPKKPVLNLDNISNKTESAPVKPDPVPAPAPMINELPPVPEIGDFDSIASKDSKGDGDAVANVSAGEKSTDEISAAETSAAETSAAEPVNAAPAPIPAPEPSEGLDGFEKAVKALKARLDGGEISAEDFRAERKKLIAALY